MHKPQGLFKSVFPANEPQQYYAIDFIIDFLPFKDKQRQTYNSVFIFIDRFSKYIQYIFINKTINTKALANLIMEKCFLKIDQLHFIIIDRGSVFTSQYWSDLCFHLKIDYHYNIAFHLQTDKQTKRQNQELEFYLCIYLNY